MRQLQDTDGVQVARHWLNIESPNVVVISFFPEKQVVHCSYTKM